jgi:hypothetical protein
MQIDTRRRDCGVTAASIHNCTTFDPWLEPKQARDSQPNMGRLPVCARSDGPLFDACLAQARYGRKPHGTTGTTHAGSTPRPAIVMLMIACRDRAPLCAGPSSSAYSGVLECPCTSRYGGAEHFYPHAATKVNGSLCEAGGVNCHNFTKRCVPGRDVP